MAKQIMIIRRTARNKNERFNHIISECNTLWHRRYKNRNDWVGKVVHCEHHQIEIKEKVRKE